MINPQWLELPMSRINFHGPKDVRAIEVLLYCGYSLELPFCGASNEYPQNIFLLRKKENREHQYFVWLKKPVLLSCSKQYFNLPGAVVAT